MAIRDPAVPAETPVEALQELLHPHEEQANSFGMDQASGSYAGCELTCSDFLLLILHAVQGWPNYVDEWPDGRNNAGDPAYSPARLRMPAMRPF